MNIFVVNPEVFYFYFCMYVFGTTYEQRCMFEKREEDKGIEAQSHSLESAALGFEY